MKMRQERDAYPWTWTAPCSFCSACVSWPDHAWCFCHVPHLKKKGKEKKSPALMDQFVALKHPLRTCKLVRRRARRGVTVRGVKKTAPRRWAAAGSQSACWPASCWLPRRGGRSTGVRWISIARVLVDCVRKRRVFSWLGPCFCLLGCLRVSHVTQIQLWSGKYLQGSFDLKDRKNIGIGKSIGLKCQVYLNPVDRWSLFDCRKGIFPWGMS
jgi:hypothetical protein